MNDEVSVRFNQVCDVVERELLNEQVNIQIVKRLSVELGYILEDERIERIAKEAGRLISENYPLTIAFSCALNCDLRWYGDPTDRGYFPATYSEVESIVSS